MTSSCPSSPVPSISRLRCVGSTYHYVLNPRLEFPFIPSMPPLHPSRLTQTKLPRRLKKFPLLHSTSSSWACDQAAAPYPRCLDPS